MAIRMAILSMPLQMCPTMRTAHPNMAKACAERAVKVSSEPRSGWRYSNLGEAASFGGRGLVLPTKDGVFCYLKSAPLPCKSTTSHRRNWLSRNSVFRLHGTLTHTAHRC